MANRNKDLNTRRNRNENRIKFFEEICNIEKMQDESKSLEEIYTYMKELVEYTREDENKYILLPKTLQDAFEHGNQNNIFKNKSLINQYIEIIIKNSYKNEIGYDQAFKQIYGILIALYNQDKINTKMDKEWKYTKDYIHF